MTHPFDEKAVEAARQSCDAGNDVSREEMQTFFTAACQSMRERELAWDDHVQRDPPNGVAESEYHPSPVTIFKQVKP